MTLSAHSYTIKYKKGVENSNANAFSRLPLPVSQKEPPKSPEVIHLMEYLDMFPLSSAQSEPGLIVTQCCPRWKDRFAQDGQVRVNVIVRKTRCDHTQGEGMSWVRRMVVCCGVVALWYHKKGKTQVLHTLHEGHPAWDNEGICEGFCLVAQRIRAKPCLTLSLEQWVKPRLTPSVEQWVQSYETASHCQYMYPPYILGPGQTNHGCEPMLTMQPFSWQDVPPDDWCAFQIVGSTYDLIIIIHNNHLMHEKVICILGVAWTVSNNATNFTSEEFKQFPTKNGVKQVRTPPYHPASNGLTERVVQTFKEGMRKLKDGSLETKLTHFLLKYRVTSQSSTGISPSELMYGQRLRSH